MVTKLGRIGWVELYVSWHDWSRAEPELRRAVPAETAAKVDEAVRFATAWHGDQRRPTGAPYLDHLLDALEVLVRGAGVNDPDVLCAAVLHDVVEDTPCTLEQVSAAFGPKVAELVGWVTIPAPAPGQKKAEVKEAYLRRLPHAPAQARLVKLADRASNVQTLRNLAPDRQRFLLRADGHPCRSAGGRRSVVRPLVRRVEAGFRRPGLAGRGHHSRRRSRGGPFLLRIGGGAASLRGEQP